MGRSRCLPLLVVAFVLPGCGSSAPPGDIHALHAWKISTGPFIPRVDDVSAPTTSTSPVPANGDSVSRSATGSPLDAAGRPRGPAKSRSQTPPSYRVAPGAPSDAQVRAELEQLYGKSAAGGAGSAHTVSLSGGQAQAPPDAPAKVQSIVAAANQVASLPYVYGGGHGADKGEGIWVDSAYDCSGSISFALASAGLVKSPLDSTGLASWGKAGRGKWVTVYAKRGPHVHGHRRRALRHRRPAPERIALAAGVPLGQRHDRASPRRPLAERGAQVALDATFTTQSVTARGQRPS